VPCLPPCYARAAVADWSATGASTLSRQDQEKVKSALEATAKVPNSTPTAKTTKVDADASSEDARNEPQCRPIVHFVSEVFASSDSSSDEGKEEEAIRAPMPPRKKRKSVSLQTRADDPSATQQLLAVQARALLALRG
jgi:hypothetical protein